MTYFQHIYPCLARARHPTPWWNLSLGGSLGLLKWKTGQDLSLLFIAAVHFQGTSIGGGYSTADVCAGVWVVCGYGRPVGGGCVGVLDTQLAAAVGVGALGIPKAHCRVSLLERIPLMSIRLQFTSATSPAR